ncbi:MAG: radical SAM family heme chaperone HemW [Steroidobacteraceae bacterium]
MNALPALALYVHMPWCVRKCPYCDFNSHALKGDLPERIYVDALIDDLARSAEQAGGRAIQSIFFGGGTPSLFGAASIERVLAAAGAALALADDVEVTLEANPGTVERGRFADYAAAGVNRISLGAQSFDAGALERLGRIHSPLDTALAIDEIRAAGIANFNLDLMYGLPGQDTAAALRDIETALSYAPPHLSHYQLTLEPGTVFAAHPPRLPDEAVIDEMLAQCQHRLRAAGLVRYEVSAYAQEGARCRHNLNYWQFGDYIGIGAGAHGKRTGFDPFAVHRSTRVRDPRRYIARVERWRDEQAVDSRQLPFEFMLNALRLVDGFEEPLFTARTGLALGSCDAQWSMLAARGLVAREDGRIRPTARGLGFLNDALLPFLPDDHGPYTAKKNQEKTVG